jgi:HEAT repeat protein
VQAVVAKTEAKTEVKAQPKAEPKTTAEGPAKADDRPEVERLIANLKDKDWFVRRDATQSLAALGDKQAVEPLVACLKDDDDRVRFSTAEALGKLGDPRAVEPLIACLKDTKVDRSYAAEALGKLGDKRAVEPLIACLKDHEVGRSYAAEALGKLGDKQAVEPLIACLKDKDERVRRQAAEALGKLGDKQAAEPLMAALPDWPIKDTIAAALKQLDVKPTTDQERFCCRVAQRDDKGLLEDWKQTRQLILDDAGSQDPRKVQSAVYTAIALGKEELVDDLVKFLNASENDAIAETYLNCRYGPLNKAAENWAAKRGFKVSGGAGVLGPAWGHW